MSPTIESPDTPRRRGKEKGIPPRPLSALRTPLDTIIALLGRSFWAVAIYPKGTPLSGGRVSEGKNPIGKAWGLERWSPDRVAAEFKRHPQAGVGICLGPGRAPEGGWLIDLEGDGPEAEASRAKLLGGEVIVTMGWPSARGQHQVFRCDGERLAKITARLKKFQVKAANQPGVFHIPALPGLELRLGGFKPTGEVKQLQSVAPPTVGTDGKPRAWNGVEDVAQVPEAFYEVLEAIAAEVEAGARPKREEAAADSQGSGMTMTATNGADSWLKKALDNAVRRLESRTEGERRDNYRNEAYCLAGYLHYYDKYGVGYSEDELSRTLKNALAVGVSFGDPVVEVTVDEAIAAGKAAPVELKPELHESATRARRNGSASNGPAAGRSETTVGGHAGANGSGDNPPPPGSGGSQELDGRLARRPRTDLGNAERLVARHGRDMRYCHPWSKWLVWDGRRWKLDDTGEARWRARGTVRAILGEAKTIDDEEKRKELALWALTSEKRDKIAAMLHLAEVERGIPVLPDKMDADPWAFNCSNGTVDLQTGKLRPHRREDLITKLCPLAYDPNAPCPLWLATLDKFFHRDDPDRKALLIGYWQRLCGYAMTGVVRDQIMPIAYGSGSNGKSTVLGAIMDVMGSDYAMKCQPDMLMARKGEQHPTERADLFGKRLVVAIETDAGRRLNETMVKELTGCDAIRARRMREDPWEFKPTHTLIMATNHKPVIRGRDFAIWRRLKLVPFTVSLNERDAIKDMPERLRAESAGILAWCVRGCLEWQRQGLDTPEEVVDATAGYRAEQDLVGLFLKECTESGTGFKEKSGDLYKRYKSWAEAGNEYVASLRAFGEAIRESGIETKTSNGVWYLGIKLKDGDTGEHLDDLMRLLKTRIEAGRLSVRESVQAAGDAGFLKRKGEGKWDAGPLWEAARKLGYTVTDSTTHGEGKIWVNVEVDQGERETGAF